MPTDINKKVAGYEIYKIDGAPIKELAEISRIAAADGAVMLKNDDALLPLKKGTKVSVFGRIQTNYYKGGTGSGGMVNVEYVTNIIDSLRECDGVIVNEKLANIYAEWIEKNPFDKGHGWATEPWCQIEMELDDAVVSDAADESDVAIVVIGRTAGEDHDNHMNEGSMLLTKPEREMLCKVCNAFDKVVVLLNTGNIIDMSFVDDYSFNSLLYLWQGGQEGGRAAADILTGAVTPSGKLADTIAYNIDDYPAAANFGSEKENIYAEDIYVGYRYFETVAPGKVRYPFGFGMSYTSFEMNTSFADCDGEKITLHITVKNTGEYSGKEVVEVYLNAPQGKLGRPLRSLVAFKKTKLLCPGDEQTLDIVININDMAAYDDSGITGHRSAYVLEAGDYELYVGTSAKENACAYTYTLGQMRVVKQLCEAIAPVKDFARMHPVSTADGFVMEYEPTPTRQIDIDKRIAENRPRDIEYTGDMGYKLYDVKNGKVTMEQFIAQLADEDLMHIAHGEGMNSPKVTPGTGAAFGGVTTRLAEFGIPVCCCTDGPSGLRMDSGAKATAMPNGTCLACTFDDELVERLYVFEGVEMVGYNIDALLGPGMNIHRHPLNGRNFEYFSEDPLLTGKIAAAICRGIMASGATATIKHFIGNNQELGRSSAVSVISERAIREIYLKPFEIAVKEGGTTTIMSTYGPVNGYWTAGNYDLLTTVLRGEWGYDGIVMTDWWAKINDFGEPGDVKNLAAMIRAQNDVYMVCLSAALNNDNLAKALKEGKITRGELQRSAMNMCRYVMNSPTFAKYELSGYKLDIVDIEDDSKAEVIYTVDNVESDKEYTFQNPADGNLFIIVDMSSDALELAQMSVSVYVDDKLEHTLSLKGTSGETVREKRLVYRHCCPVRIRLKFDSIAEVKRLVIKR